MSGPGFKASRYDVPAPWWFRNSFWLTLAAVLPAGYIGSQGSAALLLACVAAVAAAGLPLLVWDLRQRVKA